MTTSASSAQSAYSDWQRVSPWSILHFLFIQLKQSVNFAIYIVPAYIVGAHKVIDSDLLPLILIATGGSWITSAILKFLFFQFCVTEQGVGLRSGVFDRTFTDLPYERIQNVKFDQPIYFRFKDLVIVTLDTAGSSKQEAQFIGVPTEYARHLKAVVMRARSNTASPPPVCSDTPADADGQIINRRSVKDLVLHGITNNRVWIVLGTMAPFYDHITGFIFGHMNSFRPQAESWFGEQAVAFWYMGVVGALIAIFLLMVMALFSIGGSILMFYGYTLTKQDDKYIRRSGLLNRQEVSIKQSRVQVCRQQQDWLDRLLGRVNLYFEQNVTGKVNANEFKTTHKLLVPSVTVEEAISLASDVFPAQTARNIAYQTIHIRYLWRQLFVWLLPVNVIVMAVAISLLALPGLLPASAFLFLSTLLTFLHWKRWGIASDDTYVYIRKGTIGIDYWCFPLAKLQQLSIKQSLFMRRRNLVTLECILASGKESVPFVDADFAQPLVAKLLNAVEEKKPAWM